MHRIDTPDAVSGMFDSGDPLVPRFPTAIDKTWLNATQEEIAKTIEGAGLTLRASGAADEGASYASQLLEAIKKLIGRARAHVQWDGGGGVSLVAGHGVSSVALGSGKVVLTLSSPYPSPASQKPAHVTVLRDSGLTALVGATDVVATGSTVEVHLRYSDGTLFNTSTTPGSMLITLAY